MDKRFLVLVVMFSVLLLGLFYTSRFAERPPELLGKPAPVFETVTVDGQKLRLQDVIGKKAVLLNFWATWCTPCQEEMPVLTEINDALAGEAFVIVSLLEDDAMELGDYRVLLTQFQKKIPLNFSVYIDKNQAIADSYGTYKIPETYLIDKSGVIVEKIPGAILPSGKAALVARLRALARAEAKPTITK